MNLHYALRIKGKQEEPGENWIQKADICLACSGILRSSVEMYEIVTLFFYFLYYETMPLFDIMKASPERR